MGDCERERELSSEENDQLSRSTKKMKRLGELASASDAISDMDINSSMAPMPGREEIPNPGMRQIVSYRDTLQRNNPNLTFETRDNPIWMADDHEVVSDDDAPEDEDDPLCPTIYLLRLKRKFFVSPGEMH